ncbi:MAG: hypothetical protein JWQ87_2979, partial [Candidatus Sulfotelmatobacter sp.]|nr:hypothetical protein [Candidatus Sulfotelmatobacter sp.]
MDEQSATPSHRNRLLQLFEFLKAYVEQRYRPVRNIDQQLKTLWLSDLPHHPAVQLRKEGAKPNEEGENADIVLQITRPNVTACPSPPGDIAEWLKQGWENVDTTSEVYASRNTRDQEGRTRLEPFEEIVERVSSFKVWQRQREEWQANERPARRAMAIFQSVYEWYGIHEREAERIEILVGDGLLNCPDDTDAAGDFNHPVLLQRLELEFHPEKRSPQFIFRKCEKPPELYLEFLRAVPAGNYKQIARCADELKKIEVSPLGGDDAEEFLQRLIQGVFPATGWVITPENNHKPEPSESGTSASGTDPNEHRAPLIVTQNGERYELSDPAASKITGPITGSNLEASLRRLRAHGWEPKFATKRHPTIRREPVIFMRQRQSGLSSVFDLILEDIPNRIDFPAAILQILGLAPAVSNAETGDPSSLPLGNEDEDILLSKPANKEQLEIARQLSRRDCVLVQGPPGTGKTHTIANLLGHLLAQGKSVLVTAHTPKALRVLRQKVVEPLQPLCISVLQNDKQSQEELRESVKLIHVGLSKEIR